MLNNQFKLGIYALLFISILAFQACKKEPKKECVCMELKNKGCVTPELLEGEWILKAMTDTLSKIHEIDTIEFRTYLRMGENNYQLVVVNALYGDYEVLNDKLKFKGGLTTLVLGEEYKMAFEDIIFDIFHKNPFCFSIDGNSLYLYFNIEGKETYMLYQRN